LLLVTYMLAWTLAYSYVFVSRGDGLDFGHYFEYLFLAWAFNGFELPMLIWLISLVIFVPLAVLEGLIIWRLNKKKGRK